MSGDGEAVRFRCTNLAPATPAEDDGSDVVDGLRADPKTLPCRFFYDDRGSALFERICDLPEYYLTRTEQAILDARAQDVARLTGPCEIVELGAGSARKTRVLIEAHARLDHPLRYFPVDVSEGIMRQSAQGLLRRFPGLRVWALTGTYDQALANLPPPGLAARMLMFLGSTLGNLDDAGLDDFLTRVRTAMRAGEYFLVGADLHKGPEIIEAAYNDSAGVTAAFNLNMLRHLNRRFDGNFVLDRFEHLAFYDRDRHRIEMHLESRGAQSVTLRRLALTASFADGERVRTEISRKFDRGALAAAFARKGFETVESWTDERGWFALMLFRAA